MIMVPLVFFSITSGVCKMGDIKQLASVGLRFVLYILFTSGLASAVGVIVGLIFQPGKGTTERDGNGQYAAGHRLCPLPRRGPAESG